MEVLGTTPNPAPMADISAHGGASHPQRETLHGRSVMLDVAAGSEYMPGAKCEDCHMVKTNKAANRISHGMKPMLPGDAERWNTAAGGAYQGEDSCTGCHPSRTRSELQVSIDGWQEDATAQAAKVVTAITAAKTRSEFSATATTNPGYELVGRATWNYKAFENDASESVHNPTYIMAGLVKAEQMAKSVGGRFSYTSASTSVRKGRTGHVVGRVVNGDGSSAAGASVTLPAWLDGARQHQGRRERSLRVHVQGLQDLQQLQGQVGALERRQDEQAQLGHDDQGQVAKTTVIVPADRDRVTTGGRGGRRPPRPLSYDDRPPDGWGSSWNRQALAAAGRCTSSSSPSPWLRWRWRL